MRDTRRELYYAAALAADAYTTGKIASTPGLYERNPLARAFIGRQPDSDDALRGAIVAGLAHWLIARRIRPPLRAVWQFAPMILHGDAALANCGILEDCE